MGPLLVACAEGGTSIEDLAISNPEKIIKVPVDIREGITDAQVYIYTYICIYIYIIAGIYIYIYMYIFIYN